MPGVPASRGSSFKAGLKTSRDRPCLSWACPAIVERDGSTRATPSSNPTSPLRPPAAGRCGRGVDPTRRMEVGGSRRTRQRRRARRGPTRRDLPRDAPSTSRSGSGARLTAAPTRPTPSLPLRPPRRLGLAGPNARGAFACSSDPSILDHPDRHRAGSPLSLPVRTFRTALDRAGARSEALSRKVVKCGGPCAVMVAPVHDGWPTARP